MAEKKRFRATATWNGKRYECTGKSQREAEKKLAKKLADLESGRTALGGKMTCDAWFDEWMETYHPGVQASTVRDLRSVWRNWFQPMLGGMRLQDVRDVHIQRCLNLMDGMSSATITKNLRVVKGLFRQARISRLIPYDPAEQLVAPRGKPGGHRALTDEERQAVFDHPDLMELMGLLTGMRPGEMAALTWSHVDFEAGEIHVTCAREANTRSVKTTKTPAGIRDIPINSRLLPYLQEARGEPFELVFPSSRGGMLSARGMETRHIAWCRKAGVSFAMYDLRHTFCTDLASAGVPVTVARDLMGHTNIAVTANIYTHRDRGAMHAGIRLVEKSVEAQEDETAKSK